MTDGELDELENRISAGERPTDELWAIRNREFDAAISAKRAEALSDLWNLALLREGVFPKLEAAKAQCAFHPTVRLENTIIVDVSAEPREAAMLQVFRDSQELPDDDD